MAENSVRLSNLMDFDSLTAHFATLSREPFQQILASLLDCAPDAETFRQFAKEKPDKWAAAVKTFAGLAGYTEKTETQNSIAITISTLSDVELMQMLDKITGELIDVTPDNIKIADKKDGEPNTLLDSP